MQENHTTRGRSPGATTFMSGAPPFPPQDLVTLANWQEAPWNRWSFQHVRELIPTARIARGEQTWNLPRDERDLSDVRFDAQGATQTVGEHLRDSQTDGFLVIHDGHIVAEHYLNGMTEDTPHLLMSVSKSVTSAVVGILAGKGQLDVEALVSEVVPELSETSFAGATVQHLLDMRAGTGFNEDYDDPQADVRLYEQVYLWRPRTSERLPEDAIAYFATLRNDGEHGGPFRYRSVLTDVLAWVVERAARRRFHQVVADELWRAMGAEFDADVTLDAHGNALADGGISATLRDMGRFGLLHLLEPPAGAPEVVPASWVEGTIRGAPDGTEAFFAGDDPAGFPPGAHYRNCWWVRDHSLPYFNASGIYGQGVFVHHPTHTVAVKFSSRDRALDRLEGAATATAVATIGAVLARG